MKKTEAVRLAEIQRDIARDKFLSDIGRAIIISPMFQMAGSIVLTEYAEHEGWLSPRWSAAIETGVIAMVGLQALKDTGILGAAGILGSMGLGADLFGGAGGPLGTIGKYLTFPLGRLVE